ncbi:integrase core domain-containing protein [Paenibacillus marinisediminis]
MKPCMSRKGNCYDNACIEEFHSILKREFIYSRPKFRAKKKAQQKLFRYLEFFYNRKRSNSILGYMLPVRFKQLYYERAA